MSECSADVATLAVHDFPLGSQSRWPAGVRVRLPVDDAPDEWSDFADSTTVPPSRSSRSPSSIETAPSECGDVGSDDPDVADLQDIDHILELLNSPSPFSATMGDRSQWDALQFQQIWKWPELAHLFRPGNGYVTMKRTGKQIHADAQRGDNSHIHSREFLEAVRDGCAATKLFGRFDEDRVPKLPFPLPTLEDIRAAYGSSLPAYMAVAPAIPGLTALVNGKKGYCVKHWLMDKFYGLGMVFWDGQRGPKAFRSARPHTQVRATWEYTSDFDSGCITNIDVYEDPVFSETSRTHSVYSLPRDVLSHGGVVVERLLPPRQMARREAGPMGLRYSWYLDHDIQPQVGGRWWPVWLVGRTKTGWWTICYYQILDGTWRIVFWWYADVHVHLLDAMH